jgi:hypothetical protein
MVFPRRCMDFRGCHCASLSSPFFERPIPAEINQRSNNYYFEQQSHRKCEIRKRSCAKSILILFSRARHSQRFSSRSIQRCVPKRKDGPQGPWLQRYLIPATAQYDLRPGSCLSWLCDGASCVVLGTLRSLANPWRDQLIRIGAPRCA